MALMRCLFRTVTFLLIIAVSVLFINYWLAHKTYLLSHETVAQIAKKHMYSADILSEMSRKTTGMKSQGAKVEAMYSRIHADLSERFPGRILPQSDLQWVFINAGGWMGTICLVHASLTEYLVFFGTALETSGNSGRYWANISDTVLTGEFHQWSEGDLQVKVHSPGATVYHYAGEVTAVNFKSNTWMLEYGRGFIPSTLGFALADTLFCTQDFVTLYYFLRIYTKALVQELFYCVNHL